MGERTRVLVIEDERELAEMIKMRLVNAGYGVEMAFDGKEGLSKAREWKPDLITLDLILPKLDGYRVCKYLKADKEYKDIPIIMLSVRGSEEEKKAGFSAGADEYLTKPYDGEILLAKVKALINRI